MRGMRLQGLLWITAILSPLSHPVWGQVPTTFSPGGGLSARTVQSLVGERITIGPGSSDRYQVVCFLGTECPLAKLYAERLQRLADELTPRGVRFLGVFSNRQDSLEDIQRYADQFSLSFAIIKDERNELADWLSATRTPEVVVLDAVGVTVYRGRIDDQYEPGIIRESAREHYLRAALESSLDGRAPERPRTQAVGCIIGREPVTSDASDLAVTFTRDVAPVLAKHCLECHRGGQIGPFAMTDYEEIVGWGPMMMEVIDEGRMPPWHSAPPHDRFKGTRVMASSEVETLRRWVAAGMPYGDQADLPPTPQFVDGWALPTSPDEVIEMSLRPMQIPASGVVEYQYFIADPGWEEGRWIRAAQVLPGNAAVVHHAICFVRPPDGDRFRGVGWLGAYVPGQRPAELPAGHARFVPAGSKLVFQMHYTPTGKPETDVSRVGIVFANPEEVTHEVETRMAINQSFEIPPGAERHPVHGDAGGFRDGEQLLSIMPHMHFRGSAFEVSLSDASGPDTPESGGNSINTEAEEFLLDVHRYDFNWQHDYRLQTPIELSRGQRLSFVAYFDNSENNPWNPDPQRAVTWGEQSWEEMAVAFFDVSRPLSGLPPSSELVDAEVAQKRETDRREQAEQLASDFFSKLDRDQDGRISREEAPASFAAFGFWRFDNNGDRVLDREEFLDAALNR